MVSGVSSHSKRFCMKLNRHNDKSRWILFNMFIALLITIHFCKCRKAAKAARVRTATKEAIKAQLTKEAKKVIPINDCASNYF